LGYLLPRIPAICRGNNHLFKEKHAPFESAGWDVTSIVYAFPQDGPNLILADATTIKEVTLAKTRFPKPAREYGFISIYGRNIIASEGEEWKKYRKICAPAFSERNNKLVWDTSVQIMNGLFNEVWAGKDTISVDHAVEITLPIALFILGVAGFGQKMSWHQDRTIPKGHRMSMKDALYLVSTGTSAKLMLPDWSLKLTKHLQSIRIAYEELQMYMSEMIRERQQSSEKVERHV
jgi:cytochrome P450